MAEQWIEEQHLEEIVERRRMGGSSLKLDVIQKVLELVVNERVSQGEKGERHEKKRKKCQDGPLKKWREGHKTSQWRRTRKR